MSEFEGGNAVPSIFREVYSPSHKALKLIEVPSTVIKNYDWTSGNLDYQGFAAKGSLDTQAVWFIIKRTWDANGNPLTEKTADNVVWNSRTGATYS